ncbi:MAG: hypothetical protein KDC44_01290 [Phaeodactylibacter sp.]|nr:hypothetical protein [Phaeodactylibacter sp.]
MIKQVGVLALLLILWNGCAPKIGPGIATPKPSVVIDRYLEVIGGAAKLKKVHTLYLEGQAELYGGTIHLIRYSQAPDKMRVILEAQRASKVRVLNDSLAFEVTQVGNIPVDGIGLKPMQWEAQLFPQLYYKERKTRLDLLGTELVSGQPAYKLKLTDANGDVRFEFYDQETGLLVKMVDMIKSKTYYQDYREVGDVRFPFEVELVAANRGTSYVLDSVALNPVIPSTVFEFNYDW